MPPELALALCTGFVVVLLTLEVRESVGVSAAAWIPTLWMLSIASKPLGIWLGLSGDAESGSAPDRLLLLGLALAGVAILLRRRFDVTRALRGHSWMLVLLTYMLISCLWSDITFISVRRWVREVIVVIMALVVMSEPAPCATLASLLRRSAYILVPFSVLLVKYFPTLGREYGRWSGGEMWIGVTAQKNALGRLCLISVSFLLWAVSRRLRERSRWAGMPLLADVSVLLIALWLLKGAEQSYSATSLGTLGAGVTTFVFLMWLKRAGKRVSQPALLLVLIFLMGFAASAPFLGGSNLATFSSAFGRNETLTGRTDTWAELVPVVMRQPVAGYGFGSFWTTGRRDFYQMSHAHNGYLDALLELGAVGLALYAGWLITSTRRLYAALERDYDWASLGIVFLLMSVIYNATESALNSLAGQMTAVVALAALVVPYEPPLARTPLRGEPERLTAGMTRASRLRPASESSVGRSTGALVKGPSRRSR